jgi:hypothetical protein
MNRKTMLFKCIILSLAACALLGACSPAAMVKPLNKGQWAAGGSFGGPLIGFGDATIPVPFTAVSVGYGVDSNATVTARLYPTAALFGVAQIDAGLLCQWRKSDGWKPGISTLPQATFMIDRWESTARFYPSLDIHAWWDVNDRGDFFYAGCTNWFELRNRGAMDREQEEHWIPAVNAGYTLVRQKWNTAFELKYLAPGRSNENLVVDYRMTGNSGALALFVSFTRKF